MSWVGESFSEITVTVIAANVALHMLYTAHCAELLSPMAMHCGWSCLIFADNTNHLLCCYKTSQYDMLTQ